MIITLIIHLSVFDWSVPVAKLPASRRAADMRTNQVIEDFLDSHFWGKFYSGDTVRLDFKVSPDLQYRGVDVVVGDGCGGLVSSSSSGSSNSGSGEPNAISEIDFANRVLSNQDNFNANKMLVDEKAAVRYTGSGRGSRLQTFCFELFWSLRRKDSSGIGWFLRQDSLTTHYLLVFPEADRTIRTVDDVKACEFMLVSKKAVKSVLNGIPDFGKRIKGFKDSLDLTSNVKQSTVVRGSYNGKSYNFKLVASLQLREQPLNVLLDRDLLRELADRVAVYKRQ